MSNMIETMTTGTRSGFVAPICAIEFALPTTRRRVVTQHAPIFAAAAAQLGFADKAPGLRTWSPPKT